MSTPPPHPGSDPLPTRGRAVTARRLAVALALSLSALAMSPPAHAAQATATQAPATPATAAHATATHAPQAVAPQAPRRADLPAGTQFYVNPDSQVAQWVGANPGDSREPAIASRIASQPQATWFADYDPDTITSQVGAVTSAAAANGTTPVLVAYEIPDRDCGGLSSGGAPDVASYDSWMQGFAAGLGGGPVVVILEPDSLSSTDCLDAQGLADRDAALSQAGATLHSADPDARVYYDAGHSDWHDPADQANRLRAAGVTTNGDGIFSNVSNFETTSDEVTYDTSVLADLGDAALHAVVDTSRNGAGPSPDQNWCDPQGRSLGTAPTTGTGDPLIDAYLWVKAPGESDGCADGAGVFDPNLAYALATD
ncbi:glycoside hydrolase family 6 protein [Streptomyces sp. SL13]|uniref:Glucanase n=1 Tax=Streptantibioticus silvisoli TaxID=2705255 RepID=A0AA90KGW9_9ACTN|nr:glycoside hydrolase family 6 protein [Streptantibioticus silvisoli]MDI5971100.1 glycoside hydrolase family 6 protein [Streptantibioticus silvisoli]